LPKLLGKLPKLLGKLPERLGKLPEHFGKLPKRFGKLPKCFRKLPKKFGKRILIQRTRAPNAWRAPPQDCWRARFEKQKNVNKIIIEI
jgi:hypothetical protein